MSADPQPVIPPETLAAFRDRVRAVNAAIAAPNALWLSWPPEQFIALASMEVDDETKVEVAELVTWARSFVDGVAIAQVTPDGERADLLREWRAQIPDPS